MASKAVTEIAKKCLPESSDSDDVIATKMKQCLESAEQIASLESVIQTASLEFDNKPVHLVSKLQEEKLQVSGSLSNESLARASQAGIQAMRANWQWVLRVMKCAQIHLQNGAAYQQLFYEFEEAGYWMNSTLSRVHNSFNQNKLQGKHTDSTSIQEEIKEVTDAFLLWQTKVDYLYERAKEVVPVHQRVGALPHERPVTALTDFSNSEVAFIEGETLTLLDTSDRRKWKVRNSQGNESVVPSVIILIPPPCNEALDNVTRLRIQLLYLWTASIKRLGFQLIAFMLTVFRDWTQEEVAQLQQMFPEDSTEVLRMLGFIESALRQHWSDYGNFHELQARMLRLEMIIEESPTGNHSRSEFVMAVITQMHMLGDLLKMYQEFWAFWEMYRSVMELSKQPKYLLVCDKWEQLCYTTTANFVKFWDNGLAGSDDVDGLNLGIMNITSQHEEATTETVITTVQEEQHTFDIQSVLDPRDSTSQLSLQDAIRLGIVDQARTIYTNPVTGATMSMTDAINEGRILMKTISKEKIREEQRSYGIISVRLTREKHPYTVKAVVDPRTKRNLSLAQASAEGIIDMYNKIYKSETGERISLDNAISKGLVTAEYHEGPNNNLEIATKSYAVHGVVDQRKKSKVSFADAVRDGLLDKDTGDYFNNATGEKVGVQEAIMRGFIKARVVTDLSKLDIDPKNHIIIDKLDRAVHTVLTEVRVVNMFKAASKHAL